MSPLAHSLVALGALLAAADAKVSYSGVLRPHLSPNCNGIVIDITSKQFFGDVLEQKFDFTSDGNLRLHNITDRCAPYGMAIASETVEVCNNRNEKTLPPDVDAVGDERLSPVGASCGPYVLAKGMCRVLNFHITQKCRYQFILKY